MWFKGLSNIPATTSPVSYAEFNPRRLRRSAFLGENGVLLGAITTARLLASFNAGRVEGAADDLITNAREVADTTAANQNDGVFLKLMT